MGGSIWKRLYSSNAESQVRIEGARCAGILASLCHQRTAAWSVSPSLLLTFGQRKTSTPHAQENAVVSATHRSPGKRCGSLGTNHLKPAPVSLAFEKKLPEWLKESNVPA